MIIMMNRSSAGKVILVVALATVWALLLLSGCGLQTDEANKALEKANKRQEQAEAILARLRGFPAEWEANFSQLTPQQFIAAQQLVKAREQDVEALQAALNEWEAEMSYINTLNVDEKIKEYVRLKTNSIKCWESYTEHFLLPIVKGYEGLLQTVSLGRPEQEQTKAAMEISALVRESTVKLEECRDSEKQAEKYFTENRLGE
mgnify:CR=1 FL=1